jgi:hypothetical protein
MPAVTTWRRAMPVRRRIHSSEVSNRSTRSALVTTRGGTQPATPESTAVVDGSGTAVLSSTFTSLAAGAETVLTYR